MDEEKDHELREIRQESFDTKSETKRNVRVMASEKK